MLCIRKHKLNKSPVSENSSIVELLKAKEKETDVRCIETLMLTDPSKTAPYKQTV